MKSEWRVGYRTEGCSQQYGLYRLRDAAGTDNPGNREYGRIWYPSQECAEKAAAKLNRENM